MKSSNFLWIAMMALAVAVGGLDATPASAATAKCLGAEPEAGGDADDIRALATAMATACPCATFDGSKGKTKGIYLKCVKAGIAAATALLGVDVRPDAELERASVHRDQEHDRCDQVEDLVRHEEGQGRSHGDGEPAAVNAIRRDLIAVHAVEPPAA